MPQSFMRKAKQGGQISVAFIHAWLDDLKDRVNMRMEDSGQLNMLVKWLGAAESHLVLQQDRNDKMDIRIAKAGLEEVNATAQARNFAKVNGIDINQVVPSDGKRIKKSDVEAVIGMGTVESGTERVSANP